jgi:hypothetical protein
MQLVVVNSDQQRLAKYLEDTFDQLLESNPRAIWRHGRRRIPEPAILKDRILNTVQAFKSAVDSDRHLLLPASFYVVFEKANGNEGSVHEPLLDSFGCPNAGPRLTHAFLLDFAERVNMINTFDPNNTA